jgi:hypothetical protein
MNHTVKGNFCINEGNKSYTCPQSAKETDGNPNMKVAILLREKHYLR